MVFDVSIWDNIIMITMQIFIKYISWYHISCIWGSILLLVHQNTFISWSSVCRAIWNTFDEQNACNNYYVECVSTIGSFITITLNAVYGFVYIQLTHFFTFSEICSWWYHYHQIGNMIYWPLFGVEHERMIRAECLLRPNSIIVLVVCECTFCEPRT